MTTSLLIEKTFKEWTKDKNAIDARIAIYNRIRDIPYAIVPELSDTERYAEILKLQKGSCMPKHFLLGDMYQRLGLLVLYAVYPFRWDQTGINYPPQLRTMAEELPASYHLACRVDINEELVLVDATLDSPLKKLGLPVNTNWDGVSDTLLPMVPCGEEQLFHPSEANFRQTRNYDEKSLSFYRELNQWLEKARLL